MSRRDRIREHIAAEAADWFVRLRDEGREARREEEFAQWLMQSPLHIEEYLGLTRAWGDAGLGDAATVEELVRGASGEEARNVITLRPFEPSSEAATVVSGGARTTARWAAARIAGMAIVVLVAVIAGATLFYDRSDRSHIQTAIGEQRSVALVDGSVVHLNTDSEVRVDLAAHERRISLVRGEARFTVAKDPNRPFYVATPQATVRAVGTVFNVQTLSTRTTVTVIEGRVALTGNSDRNAVGSAAGAPAIEVKERDQAVSKPGASIRLPSQPLELQAGQQAEVTARGDIVPNAGPSVERVLAWPERRLVFRDESLGNVLAEFNRYNSHRLRVEDAAVAGLRISGSFYADDMESLVQYLEDYEGLRVDAEAGGSRLLVR